MTAPNCAAVGVLHSLEQDTYLSGDPTRPITDLTPEHRLNLVLMMVRNADALARKYEVYTRWDDRPCPPIDDPAGWIVTMPLFRALVADLPSKRNRLAAVDERARHDATCPGRTSGICDCDPRPGSSRELLAVITAARVVTV